MELLKENCLNLFIDMIDWMNYLIYNKFNFSCGSRIHGNIMPILSGIPARVCAQDTRTKEMAEFFDIPIVSEKELKSKDLYDIYLETDYSAFNEKFSSRYEYYEAFLIEHHIIREGSDKQRFLNPNEVEKPEEQRRFSASTMSVITSISNNRLWWKAYDVGRGGFQRMKACLKK